jgi:hypothetical protein
MADIIAHLEERTDRLDRRITRGGSAVTALAKRLNEVAQKLGARLVPRQPNGGQR